MSVSFETLFGSRVNSINTALDGYVKIKENYQKKIYSAMRYSLLSGGKRLRGVLALAGGSLAGGNEKEAMPIACALEMIHAYSLIHDDLPAMDNDDMRRGQPTCHKKYDEATAILAGDALLNGAFELMLRESKNAENTLSAMKIISDASGTEGMIGGQVVDLESENREISLEELKYLHRHKTGALIRGALLGGYTACGGKDNEIYEALQEYAEKIGLAFQVQDDILDVTSSSDVLGKPINSDDRNSKNTFVTHMGLEDSKKLVEDLSRQAADIVKNMGQEGQFLAQLALYLSGREF